jgi:hypothetical protein
MKIQNAKTIILKRLAPSCIALIGGVLGVASSTSSHAALIQITDIRSNIFSSATLGAPNAGLGEETQNILLIPAGQPGSHQIPLYNYSGATGFQQFSPFSWQFALASLNPASPYQFAQGDTIDASDLWNHSINEGPLFRSGSIVSPDFGPNTYMGFRSFVSTGNYIYGYLEVTWASATDTFTIEGGAYESDYNVGIMTPSTPSAAVPEPGQVAASLLLLSGIGGYIFLKRRKAAKPAVAPTAA